MLRASATLLIGALALHTTAAFAQAGDAAAAEVLFREGRAASDAGNPKLACEKFRESHRLDPAPGTALNIADCEETLGRLATAWTYFSEVAAKLPASDERQAIARARAGALEPRLPRLRLRLAPTVPADTTVRRGEVVLRRAALDTPLPVDPGEHRVEVRAAGHEPRHVVVTLREGEQRTLTLDVGKPVSLEDGPGVGAAPKGGSGSPTVGYVLGGLGVVGLGVGAVTGAMVLSKKSTVDANCDADKRCNRVGADAADSGRTLGTVSGVSFVVGAVLLGSGAYLVLSGDRERPSAALMPTAGGAALHGSF
ncbi:MAG: hypothetical protein KF718_16090 [Polyangiaceae bacterium]|nr:hypothetical protein [Polyangiaceae bacterium]